MLNCEAEQGKLGAEIWPHAHLKHRHAHVQASEAKWAWHHYCTLLQPCPLPCINEEMVGGWDLSLVSYV
jgi:hypothetical protein